MILVYISLVRSILEYACIAFSNLLLYLSDAIETVRKRALQIIFPMPSYTKALTLSNLQSLQDRRIMACKRFITSLNQINLHRLISGRVVDTQYNYALRPRKEIQIFVALSTINFSLAIYFYYSLLARPVIQLFILQEVLIKITTQLLKRTLDVWN